MKLTLNENEITAFVVQGLAAQGINIETTDVVYTKGRGNNDGVTAEFDASFLGATTKPAPSVVDDPAEGAAVDHKPTVAKRKTLSKAATKTEAEEPAEEEKVAEDPVVEDDAVETVDEPTEEIADPETEAVGEAEADSTPSKKRRVCGNRK